MTYEEKALAAPHRLTLDDRSRLTITGVTDVESFDEGQVVLHSTRGVMIVRGRDLHLQQLSLDGGQILVDGTVESIVYEDDGREAGGFFARLFG